MGSDFDESIGDMLTGEEIVISGISGHFPFTENTQKLIHNLYNKVDMVRKVDNMGIKHPELPQHYGKIDNLDKFDNQFFRFTHPQAASFNGIGRKNLEHAFSAIFDAGINPETLKGTKLGVFIGAAQIDEILLQMFDISISNGFTMSSSSKAMLANRISYWIDSIGPSYNLDYLCASSIACLQIAYERMKAGDCDSALVGGCNHVLHPSLSVNMKKAGLLCLDGKTKCFDKNGDGYARSDGVNIMFLQKAENAKRIYTQIYHVNGKHFSRPDSLFLPSRNSEDIEKFLKEFYSEVDVSPNAVEYIEANATGIAEADAEELVAIGNIFGKVKPIKVGSIKSNIGHTESASGICSLTKICLSYQRGEIPANLHYNEPQDQIDVIRDGKVQIVTDNAKFDRSYTALNNFSYSGANFHVLLKGHYKPKDKSKYKSKIPYLVLASGRLDKSVFKILSALEENPIDPEQIGLLNNIFQYNIPGHTGRGYTIIETNSEKSSTKCLARGFEIHDGNVRPIWFLYSGMGSQWPTMGANLMHLPVFADAITRCNKVLSTKGIDIIKIITEDDKEIFNNIIHCFVGITAIQIALTEVLRSISISPDNIIGHSAGEIGCAYADGSLTLEEAILLAYLRGLVSLETKMIKGKMAAIGLDHKEIRKICPAEIDIACENSSESTTISGPAEVVEKFVASLTERSIFARIVASSNIAYHSRYMADAGPSLLSKMKDVIRNPKARSKLWLSTSFSTDRWSEETCLFASAEYFTHNLLNTVHFEHTAKMIPNDAIVIEIAPHGLMQAIMKRSHKSCINLSLTRRGEENTVKFLLQTIGTLYQAGLNPDIGALYPKIDFPVSTETSVLSHLVDWDHSEVWCNKNFNAVEKKQAFSYEFIISTHDEDYNLYQGSIRNGVIIFPEAAVLVTVWKTVSMYNGITYHTVPIEFTDVQFYNEVIVEPEKLLKLLVEIQKGRNFFEVTQNNNLIASGFISLELSDIVINEPIQTVVESDYHLDGKDVYNLLSTRGYTYKGQFRSIKHTNIERNKGLIKWNDNWITFLDSLFQLNALSRNHNGISNLKLITSLVIDVEAHKIAKKTVLDSDVCYSAQISFDNTITRSGGVLLTSIAFKDVTKETHMVENLQIRQLFPHKPQFSVDLLLATQVNLQIISERLKRKVLIQYNKIDLFTDMITVFEKIVETFPSINIETKIVAHYDSITPKTKPDVILLHNMENSKIKKNNLDEINTKFVITIGPEKTVTVPKNFSTVTKFKVGNLIMVLLEKMTSKVVDEKLDGYYYIPAQVKSNELQYVKLINGISNGCNKYAWAEIPSVPKNKTIQVVYSEVYANDYKNIGQIGENVNKNGTGFSGINIRGERVMGAVSDRFVSSLVEANYDLLWPVPKHWNLEEAATVPLPYIQAYYCLAIRDNLRKRSNVYITKGDSALGQALISLCLHLECSVFTTVSNTANKKFLLKNFEKLEESHIGYTNDVFFRLMVMKITKNEKCDFVMNCDRGANRQEAMRFTGPLGIFLDINDHDMEENEDYGMAFNAPAKSYKSIRLSNIFMPEYSEDTKKLHLMLKEGISNGCVRPITRMIFSPNEISRENKLLSTENNFGSILINMKDSAILKDDFKFLPRIELSPSKSYIVVCDGTELGTELIEHLIQRGARRFSIHMKPKLMNGYFHVKYASWKKYSNMMINFNSDDLHTIAACETLITQSEKLGDIDGIFVTQNELIKESCKINQNNVDISLIVSNLDVVSRKCALNHYAVIFYTSQDYNKTAFMEIEKCSFARSKLGLPSLILRYESNNEKMLSQSLSKLYTALETSIKQNYTSVFLTDSKPKSRSNNEVTVIQDGLGAFFNKMYEDECVATEPIISMKTLLNNEQENELYMDPDETYVMLVPGFDGNYQHMTSVAERLKIRAITLQLEPDLITSIPDIAQHLLTILKKRFHMKSKFYLLGYSFGVNVALELAALLEKEGRTGVVFCLDSSPDALKNQLIAYNGNLSDQQLQNSVIEHIYNLLTGETFEEFKEDTAKSMEWSEKINKFVDKVNGSVSHTHQFLKTLVNAAYRRIIMAKAYEPDFKLESELVLIKGTPHPKSESLSDDYDLSKYTNKPVKVFNIEADHAAAPQDIRVCNIINKMLDPELLEAFENKNLCQYYTL